MPLCKLCVALLTLGLVSTDPPGKLALSSDEITESSVRLSWRFEGSLLRARAPADEAPVDGFVLTFARMSANPGAHVHVGQHAQQQRARLSNSTTEAVAPPHPSVDQWQALQLAPQQRSHQLKSLECGTHYAMKIWAFNKIGKGEPSEPLFVSTRGKAPVAPDRRSFVSANSSQVRLHLGAWYDGGCPISKFVVQYRARPSSTTRGGAPATDWLLVSNNVVPRDQTSLVVGELSPATTYELLVGAHNHVGVTEARYRVSTLDANGLASSSSMLSSLMGDDANDDDDDLDVQYSDADAGNLLEGQRARRRDMRADSAGLRWVHTVRQVLNSPLALLVSLSLFIALLLVLLYHRKQQQQEQQQQQQLQHRLQRNKHDGLLCKRNGGNEAHMLAASSPNGLHHLGHDASNASSSMTTTTTTTATTADAQDTPVRMCAAAAAAAGGGGGHYAALDTSECGLGAPPSGAESMYAARHYAAAYQQQQPPPPPQSSGYASVQRSATLDLVGDNVEQADAERQRAECLMQMLMLANPPEQQQQQHYVASTMARAPNNRHYAGPHHHTLGRACPMLQQQQQQQLDALLGDISHADFPAM